MSAPRTADDPVLVAARERLVEAVDRTYRRLAAGTLRHKRIPAARLALIFTAIASDLVERVELFRAAAPPPDDDAAD